MKKCWNRLPDSVFVNTGKFQKVYKICTFCASSFRWQETPNGPISKKIEVVVLNLSQNKTIGQILISLYISNLMEVFLDVLTNKGSNMFTFQHNIDECYNMEIVFVSTLCQTSRWRSDLCTTALTHQQFPPLQLQVLPKARLSYIERLYIIQLFVKILQMQNMLQCYINLFCKF